MDLQVILIQFDTKFLPRFERKIADCQSLHSDPSRGPGQISRKVEGAKQAERLIFISTFLPYWETDKLIRTVGQKAYLANYEGRWKEVQEYLENYQSDPHWFIENYLQNHSPEELFGNFLRRCMKEMNLIQIKPEGSTSRRKVRKPQRRRGYNDKGTLRLLHQNHGEKPVPRLREDRRPKIAHPLLKDFSLANVNWDEHTSQEGGNLDE